MLSAKQEIAYLGVVLHEFIPWDANENNFYENAAETNVILPQNMLVRSTKDPYFSIFSLT